MPDLVWVATLKDHPRNHDFFDDMTGEKWEEFKRSIRETHGAREPIVITENDVIISGHQRVRAHRELGIEQIMATTVHYYGDEAKMLRDLVELNVRQRGYIDGNAWQKENRRKVVEEYYTSVEEKTREESGDEAAKKAHVSSSQIAAKSGVDSAAYSRSKQITATCDKYPILKQWLDEERIAESTIHFFAQIPDVYKEDVLSLIIPSDNITQKMMQEAYDIATGKEDDDEVKKKQEAFRKEIEEKNEALNTLKKEAEAAQIKAEEAIRENERLKAERNRRNERSESIVPKACGDDKSTEVLEGYNIIDQSIQSLIVNLSSMFSDASFVESFAKIDEERKEYLKENAYRAIELIQKLISNDF